MYTLASWVVNENRTKIAIFDLGRQIKDMQRPTCTLSATLYERTV
jgi:hypothetical protein